MYAPAKKNARDEREPSALGRAWRFLRQTDRGRVLVWLVLVLLMHFVLAAVIAAGLFATGNNRALLGVAPAGIRHLRNFNIGDDSWLPMLKGYRVKTQDPQADIYRVFFHDHFKLQYPPSALLIFDLLPASVLSLEEEYIDQTFAQFFGPATGALVVGERGGRVNPDALRFFGQISWLCLLLTACTCVAIFEVSVARTVRPLQGPASAETRTSRLARYVLLLLLAFTFSPLIRAYTLGQIQVMLNLGLSVAILAYLRGWEGLAGACIAVCCLIKPHYGVLLLWGLLRRKWRFTCVCVTVVGVGLAVSVARFGLSDHLSYLQVLRTIALHGEASWSNQSVNGFLHRLLGNGDAVKFNHNAYAPYHPVVYIATLLSSLLFLGLALWPAWGGRRASGGPVDLVTMVAAATIASPVAWSHHYGAFLACFAMVVPTVVHVRPLGRTTLFLVCFSFLAMANVVAHPLPPLLFRHWLPGILASHLFLGAVTFFVLLLALQKTLSRTAAPDLRCATVPLAQHS